MMLPINSVLYSDTKRKLLLKPIKTLTCNPMLNKIKPFSILHLPPDRLIKQQQNKITSNGYSLLYLQVQNSLRNFSTSIIRKTSWQDDMADRYTRLNRFQQYQQYDYYDNNHRSSDSLGKLTIIGLATMTGIFMTSNLLFEYVPPFTYFRNKPKDLVYTILGINIAIFGLWQSPRLVPFLQKYMLLKKGQLINKWSLITSAFSHQEFWHLGMNMLALWSFGTTMATMLGSANFLSLYMNSAIAGSLFSLWYPVLARIFTVSSSLGASSALFGVFGCFSYLIPNAKILLFIFPVPGGAWVAFLASVVWNATGCVLRWGSFDYAAHLGGSAIGVLYGWLIQKKIEEKRSRLNKRWSESLSASSRWF